MATITKKKGGAYRVKTSGEGASEDTYDEVSLWTHASDVTFDDNKTLVQKISDMTSYVSGTLIAGNHGLTVWGVPVDSMVDIYVPDAYMKTLIPESISRTGENGLGITFPSSVSLSENVEIRVRYF